MPCEFTLFTQLPPEIRLQIWTVALTDVWSITSFKTAGKQPKCIGAITAVIGRACRESRMVMKATHGKFYIRHKWLPEDPKAYRVFLAWFNFSRHVFVFRDLDWDHKLLKFMARCGALRHVEHIILNPRKLRYLMSDIDQIKHRCISLRTLTVVAPWVIDPLGDDPHVENYWGAFFDESPKEFDMSALFDALETDDDDLGNKDRPQFLVSQQVLEQFVEDFLMGAPRLYLRTRNQLAHSKRH